MLKEATHKFWEWMGVVSGIFLLISGIHIFNNYADLKNLGLLNVVIGLGSIIVDGFIFLPSWRK